jgi:hypothetical protein
LKIQLTAFVVCLYVQFNLLGLIDLVEDIIKLFVNNLDLYIDDCLSGQVGHDYYLNNACLVQTLDENFLKLLRISVFNFVVWMWLLFKVK